MKIDLNDYSVCELTLLPFNDFTKLIKDSLGAQKVSMQFTLQRIGLEIDFKLNEFMKNRLQVKTRPFQP